MDRHDWDERYRATDLLWSAAPNRLLADEVGDLTPGRALDLAAGEGRNALWLAEQGWDVTAVDFSAVATGKGREIAARRGLAVDWVVADVLDWDPGTETYDLVLVLYLQLPAPERTAVLRAASRAVAPGGTAVLIGHDLANLDGGHGGPQDPELLWTPDRCVEALEGLVVDNATTVGREVPTDHGTAVALDTLVRAHRVP